jgi:hypothetical protein
MKSRMFVLVKLVDCGWLNPESGPQNIQPTGVGIELAP